MDANGSFVERYHFHNTNVEDHKRFRGVTADNSNTGNTHTEKGIIIRIHLNTSVALWLAG